MRVITIGHASIDTLFQLEGYPDENSKVLALERGISGGGPAANAAALLARWGTEVAFAGPVGDDLFGRAVQEELNVWGVDTSLTRFLTDYPTPLSALLVNRSSGSRTIINHRETEDCYILPETPDTGAPQLLLFDGHAQKASVAAMERWPEAITVLDAGSLRGATWDLASRVDYLVASAAFASAVADEELNGPEEGFRALEILQRRNERCSVITLGGKGGVWARGAERGGYQAYKADTVDTSAAGDIFHGAFAYALIEGHEFEAALHLAAVAAGLSTERPGGRGSIPSLPEVMERL